MQDSKKRSKWWLKVMTHPIHSRRRRVKYFDLTNSCEEGSVASKRSWAILSWRKPKLLLASQLDQLARQSANHPKQSLQHLKVISISNNNLRRVHAGLHDHPHPTPFLLRPHISQISFFGWLQFLLLFWNNCWSASLSKISMLYFSCFLRITYFAVVF